MTIEGGSAVVDTAALLSTTVVLAVEVTNTVLPETVETGIAVTLAVTFAVCELVVSTRVDAEDPADREAEDRLEFGDC